MYNLASPPNPFLVLGVVLFIPSFYDFVYVIFTTFPSQELTLHHTILSELLCKTWVQSVKMNLICVVFTYFDSWVSSPEHGLIPVHNCKLKENPTKQNNRSQSV